MIDALDAVWLIDFATSVDLPLFTDMCKFEMARPGFVEGALFGCDSSE